MADRGRPLKFQDVDAMQQTIDEFFEYCDLNKKPYTITGLALALDTSRETLLEYQERDDFVDTIKTAKLRCHQYAEDYLYTGKNTVGAIFSLKNNYGWRDKQETDVTTDGQALNFTIARGSTDNSS